MAAQPGDQAHVAGMDFTVVLHMRRGVKAIELCGPNKWGDLEPKDNSLLGDGMIMPMLQKELTSIWGQGPNEFLGVKGRWNLMSE